MPAGNGIEQLNARALDTEDSHSVSDFRPFNIEIGLDEVLGQYTNLKLGLPRETPVGCSVARQRGRAYLSLIHI